MSSVRRKQILCFYLFCLQSGQNKSYVFIYFVYSQDITNIMLLFIWSPVRTEKKMLWFFPKWYPLKNLTQKQKNGVNSTIQVIRISAHRIYEKLSGEKKNLYFIFYVNLGICHIEHFMCIILHIQKQSIIFIIFPSGTPEPLFTSLFPDIIPVVFFYEFWPVYYKSLLT